MASRLLFFSILWAGIAAGGFSRGPRPRPVQAKPTCPTWGTEIGGYCLWKGSHFPVRREVADELCKRSGGHVFLPIQKPKNLLLQVEWDHNILNITRFNCRKSTEEQDFPPEVQFGWILSRSASESKLRKIRENALAYQNWKRIKLLKLLFGSANTRKLFSRSQEDPAIWKTSYTIQMEQL